MKNKAKLIILHNIISPYRLPIFEELSKKYDLDVYFASLLKAILQYSGYYPKSTHTLQIILNNINQHI